ncbi:CPBP family intramembrane glutamic endopeptidase [uncultured Roseobacter sp.]|uniref:CPBP family intramembrane glutamic endopeptidase n=1 Tax=uncultured Roseobacter sp. TaxID=114847 RepID=UPI00260DEA0A|nr:type II CAAX endopeptidase family protein [uncultured Roseobacter sp.]
MLSRQDYRAHDALIEPVRPTAQLWRLVIGLILVAGVYLLCNQMFFQFLGTVLGPGAVGFFTSLNGGTSPVSMLILLGTFGFMTLGVAVAVRVAHNRGITSVFGDFSRTRRQFLDVLIVLLVLNAAIFVLPPWGMGVDLAPNLGFSTWMLILPLSVGAVLVQVSAEEILFRGYIQQQLAARFRPRVVWLIVPSLLFGLGHYMPLQAGPNATLIALWAVMFGVLMADLTARSGTLGPAIAVHFVNNVAAILFVSLPDGLSGLSLYVTPFSMEDADTLRAWLPVDFALMFVSWLGARLALRR